MATGKFTWSNIHFEFTYGLPGVSSYALLDGAQIYHTGFYEKHRHQHLRLITLLQDSVEPNTALVGPILVKMEESERFGFADDLMALFKSMNAVSFFSTSMELAVLRRHLTWLTEVVHDDGTEWVLRYFDPRILPYWSAILSMPQKQEALLPISRWIYMNIEGNLEVMLGEGMPLFKVLPRMQLSNEQQEYLLTKSLPYSVLSSLEDDDPTLLKADTYAEKVRVISKLVEGAVAQGLHTFIDIKAFCVIGCCSHPNFIDVVEVKEALKDGAAGKFHAHVLDWGDDVWGRLQ